MSSEDYRIAAGSNVAIGGLIRITDIIPPGSEAFAGPKAISLYDDGQVKPLTNKQLFTSGWPNVTWEFGFMYYEQLDYLKQTYCSGGLSGNVTIYTTLGGLNYYRMNATMHLKKAVELTAEIWYKNKIPVTFIGLETAS